MEIKFVEMNVPALEAVQVTSENLKDVAAWCGGRIWSNVHHTRIVLTMTKPGGRKYEENVYVGDWITRNPQVNTFETHSDSIYHTFYREVVTVRCQFCQTDKPFSEMSKRTDGQFSTMCQFCEDEELAKIQARRESLQNRGMGSKAIREYLGEKR